jgi:hypothetical protein
LTKIYFFERNKSIMEGGQSQLQIKGQGGGGGGGGGGSRQQHQQHQDQNALFLKFSTVLDETLSDEIKATFPSSQTQQVMKQLKSEMHEIEMLGKKGKFEQAVASYLAFPTLQDNQNLILLGKLHFIKGLLSKKSFPSIPSRLQHLEKIEEELNDTPFYIFIGGDKSHSPRGPTILAWSALATQYESLEKKGHIKEPEVGEIKKRFRQKLATLDEGIKIIPLYHIPTVKGKESRQKTFVCSLSISIQTMYDTIQKGLKEVGVYLHPSDAFSKIMAVLLHYEKQWDSCLEKNMTLWRKSYNDVVLSDRQEFQDVFRGDVVFIPFGPEEKQEGIMYSPDSIYRGQFSINLGEHTEHGETPLHKLWSGWGWYEYLKQGSPSHTVLMRIGQFKDGRLNGKGIELHYDHGKGGGHQQLTVGEEKVNWGKAMIRIGEWVDDDMKFGRVFYHNGDVYYGKMEKDKLKGEGYMFQHENMQVTFGTFQNSTLKTTKETIPLLREIDVKGVKTTELSPGIFDYLQKKEKEMEFDMYLKKLIYKRLQQKKSGKGGGGGVTRQQALRSFQQQQRRQREKTQHLHWIETPPRRQQQDKKG